MQGVFSGDNYTDNYIGKVNWIMAIREFTNPSGKTVWRVSYTLNKKRTQATFHTPDEAIKFQKMVNTSGAVVALRAVDGNATTLTFREWTLSYLDPASGLLTGIEPGTRDEYQRIAEHALFPILGDYPIDAIDKTAVGKWVTWQEAQPSLRRKNALVSAKTVKNRHGILSSILRAAADNNLRADNPAYRTRLSKGTREEAVFLSLADFNALYLAIADRWKPLVSFLARSQCRLSEALALTWADFNRDTDPPTVRISKAWKRNPNGSEVIGPPKSDAGRRTISLPPALLNELGKPGRARDLVFANPDGGKIPRRTFAGAWERAIIKSGIDQSPRIHDLRHTGVSWLIADGIPLSFIKQRLGHSDISVTDGTYGHLQPDAHTRMAISMQYTMSNVLPELEP